MVVAAEHVYTLCKHKLKTYIAHASWQNDHMHLNITYWSPEWHDTCYLEDTNLRWSNLFLPMTELWTATHVVLTYYLNQTNYHNMSSVKTLKTDQKNCSAKSEQQNIGKGCQQAPSLTLKVINNCKSTFLRIPQLCTVFFAMFSS